MAEIFVPTLHTFENNNIFTGSCGFLRFRIEPNVVMATPKEVDLAASSTTRSCGMARFAMSSARWNRSAPFPCPRRAARP